MYRYCVYIVSMKPMKLPICYSKTNSFAIESAKRRVFSQKLPSENDSFMSAGDHHLMIQSLINPTYESMIRACGALLKFLDKHNIGEHP